MEIESIGVWGDSITYGAGDEQSLGWVGRLRRRLEVDYGVHTYNFGIPAETSAGLLSRFKTELKSAEPDLVLIAIGTNDSIFRDDEGDKRETLPELYRENLKELFRLAKDQTKHVFAVGFTIAHDRLVQPLPWSTTRKSYKTSILQEYDEAMRQVAQANDVNYISMWDVLDVNDLTDGLHPNAAGYEKMFVKIHTAINSLLEA